MVERLKKNTDLEDSKVELNVLSERLIINRHKLDDELIEQGDLYNEAGQHHALAISRCEQAKSNRDYIYAQLDLQYRQRASDNRERSTEAMIANSVEVSDAYILANNTYHEWKEMVSRWDSLKSSFSQRAHLLHDLITLWSGGYWTKQAISVETGNVARERLAEARYRRDGG